MTLAPSDDLTLDAGPADPVGERERETAGAMGLGTKILLGVLAVLFLFLAMVPTDIVTQTLFVLAAYMGLLATSIWERRQVSRYAFFAIVTLLSLRYLVWRSTETLSADDLLSLVLTYVLYGAELFGFLLFALSLVVNLSPRRRTGTEPATRLDDLPTVDILIPTYNEPVELLAVTIAASCQVTYPKSKLAVYVLDDGGTRAKLAHPDPEIRRVTAERAEQIKAVCDRMGAIYMTREDNRSAKAGNLNAAYVRTGGELILVLDADHVPTADILWRTVGYFQRDPKLFLVQTPHFMANPDPIEKNLDTFQLMPSENEMFFRQIQCGLDFWDSSFYCGSAGVLRRAALDEVGGFGTETVTEDAETSIDLHARGWRSIYVDRPMITGLAPETFTGFVRQRIRWAQGMIQIFLLKNPLRKPGLTLGQRIGYLSSCLYWFFPIARVTFLAAPLAFLLFGRHVYDVSAEEFLAYTVPHFLGFIVFTNAMFRHVRWPFIGAVYELMQSLFALVPVIGTILRPHAPRFAVTPKREFLDQNFISPLAAPFYAILLLILIGYAGGLWRWYAVPDQRDVVLITLLWNTLNLIGLLSALGALYERRQRRSAPRIPASLEARLAIDGREVEGRLLDLSVGGACFVPYDAAAAQTLDFSKPATVHTERKDIRRSYALRLKRVMPRGNGEFDEIGLSFATPSLDALNEVVSLVHGDSGRLKEYWDTRPEADDAIDALFFLLRMGLVSAIDHVGLMVRMAVRAVLGRRMLTSIEARPAAASEN